MKQQSNKLKDGEMRKLSETQPEFIDGAKPLIGTIGSLFALVCVVCAVINFYTNDHKSDFTTIAIVILVLTFVILFNLVYLDKTVWLWEGKETISYDSKRLMIQRKRLLFRKNIIYWEDIKSVSIYKHLISATQF